MKKISKIFLLLIILTSLLIPISKAITEKEEKKEPQTNYNVITEEDKVKFKNFIEIREDYEKFVVFEGILFVIVILMIIKTKAIETSTKASILIAVIAIAAYALRCSVIGNIIYTLDIFLQFLGVILIVLADFFIYKHDNLLIYIPVCLLGIYYSITHLDSIKSNILIQIFLIAAPIALYILGGIMAKAKELELLIPVKEKHERKNDETK